MRFFSFHFAAESGMIGGGNDFEGEAAMLLNMESVCKTYGDLALHDLSHLAFHGRLLHMLRQNRH